MNDFVYHELLPTGDDTTSYRKITSDYVESVQFDGKDVLKIDVEALKLLAREAFHDTSHYLRAEHLEQLAKILKDDEASNNDKFVALELLKNARLATSQFLAFPIVTSPFITILTLVIKLKPEYGSFTLVLEL